MKYTIFIRAKHIFVLAFCLLLAVSVAAQRESKTSGDNDVTVLVTVMPNNDRSRTVADKLVASDFAVKESRIAQQIISARKAGDAPVSLAVVIQDDLVGRVSNELGEIKDFIRGLPDGSNVMTAYVSSGKLAVRQEFTNDRTKAANSLRILISSSASTTFSPYLQVVDALKMFKSQPVNNRRMLLFISDGLDNTFGMRLSSPFFSVYLDRAVVEAQNQRVAVFSMFAPSAGLNRRNRHVINYGQGSLLRLADETGGEAFFSGSGFVTFRPYFNEYNALMKDQWLITYRSTNTGKKFRKIEVTIDFDLHLHHAAGYRAADSSGEK